MRCMGCATARHRAQVFRKPRAPLLPRIPSRTVAHRPTAPEPHHPIRRTNRERRRKRTCTLDTARCIPTHKPAQPLPPTEDQRREDHSPLCGGALGSEQEQRSRRYEGQPEKQAVLASFVERTTAWCDQRDRPDSEGRRDESPAGERRAPHLSAANEEQNRKVPPAIFNGRESRAQEPGTPARTRGAKHRGAGPLTPS